MGLETDINHLTLTILALVAGRVALWPGNFLALLLESGILPKPRLICAPCTSPAALDATSPVLIGVVVGCAVVEGTPAVCLGVGALSKLAGSRYSARSLQGKQVCRLPIPLLLIIFLTELVKRAVEERGILGC